VPLTQLVPCSGVVVICLGLISRPAVPADKIANPVMTAKH